MNKQSGYTAIELLMVLVAVAAFAGGLFFFYTIARLAWAAINALGG